MQLKVNSKKWKRFFSVPCSLTEDYLKLADASALKLILYLLSDESDEFDKQSFIKASGVTEEAFEDALLFWKQLGVISVNGEEFAKVAIAKPADKPQEKQSVKVLHASYSPKDIKEMLVKDSLMKELFVEAEHTLGRLLKHADHEMLINLLDFYGLKPQSVILILEYCKSIGHAAAGYIDSVARDFFENGITDFVELDAEISRRKDLLNNESKIAYVLKTEAKLTKKQSEYIKSWLEMGFGEEMIAEARERCVDATNKLSFPYINKILQSWASKNIFTLKQLESEAKPQATKEKSSFSIDEFDSFTLGDFVVKEEK